MPTEPVLFGDIVVGALWPGSPPAPTESGQHNPDDLVYRYWAVPHRRTPRYLLPAQRRAAVTAVRHFGASGRAVDALRNSVMRVALLTTGRLPFRSDLLEIVRQPAASRESIEGRLTDVLGEPVRLGMHFGGARANRKPVVQVLDVKNRPIAFAKVGLNEVTRPLVKGEGRALAQLAELDLPGVIFPRLIHQEAWHDVELIVMTPLPTWKAKRDVGATQREEAMATVARATGTQWLSLTESQYVLGLRHSAESLRQDDIRKPVCAILDALCARDVVVPFGAWHGDWTVWNMARLQDRVLLWDWERFTAGVPQGFDSLHFARGRILNTHGPVPTAARGIMEEAPDLLRRYGVSHGNAQAVASLYLVELALRYTHDSQRTAGGRTAIVEDWVLPVLTERWRPEVR